MDISSIYLNPKRTDTDTNTVILRRCLSVIHNVATSRRIIAGCSKERARRVSAG